ncbi:unnamed protein product, partial [Amoebophrya sp. A25]|eukprot:GSA25T00000226001.1
MTGSAATTKKSRKRAAKANRERGAKAKQAQEMHMEMQRARDCETKKLEDENQDPERFASEQEKQAEEATRSINSTHGRGGEAIAERARKNQKHNNIKTETGTTLTKMQDRPLAGGIEGEVDDEAFPSER